MTSDCELDDIFWKLEELVRTDSKVIRKLKPRFKKLCEQATDFDRVEKLSRFPAWGGETLTLSCMATGRSVQPPVTHD